MNRCETRLLCFSIGCLFIFLFHLQCLLFSSLGFWVLIVFTCTDDTHPCHVPQHVFNPYCFCVLSCLLLSLSCCCLMCSSVLCSLILSRVRLTFWWPGADNSLELSAVRTVEEIVGFSMKPVPPDSFFLQACQVETSVSSSRSHNRG